ncbi:hypothetical protein RTG_01190 [Rhodotorula toruloides ATCC 204091]|uniref:Uncharacterized protein n=1 Tax=Rhodotorula toruloides TaxID=5286 RepID=A0A0K3C7D8_RHOTO|nr:hypothetical protein RTG_01190 [Rhodotorula toruloides ATCC 204091]PRQ77975.1 hypothetical protein AAT19DRAFT_9043 [Rhodotorula toruloides]
MSEPYDDIRTSASLLSRAPASFTSFPPTEDMLGSHEQHFLEDQYGGYENLMASTTLEEIPKAVRKEENVSEIKEESQEPQMEIEEDVKPSVKNEEEETRRPPSTTPPGLSPNLLVLITFVLRPPTPSSIRSQDCDAALACSRCLIDESSQCRRASADLDPPLAEPPLTDKERKILKSGWGDWTNFCTSYGLKPWDQDDAAEAKAILEAMARQDEE